MSNENLPDMDPDRYPSDWPELKYVDHWYETLGRACAFQKQTSKSSTYGSPTKLAAAFALKEREDVTTKPWVLVDDKLPPTGTRVLWQKDPWTFVWGYLNEDKEKVFRPGGASFEWVSEFEAWTEVCGFDRTKR